MGNLSVERMISLLLSNSSGSCCPNYDTFISCKLFVNKIHIPSVSGRLSTGRVSYLPLCFSAPGGRPCFCGSRLEGLCALAFYGGQVWYSLENIHRSPCSHSWGIFPPHSGCLLRPLGSLLLLLVPSWAGICCFVLLTYFHQPYSSSFQSRVKVYHT